MRKKNGDRANVKKGLAVFFILFLLLAVFSVFSMYRRYQRERFAYEDHLEDAVIQVDGEAVTLRGFGYYIYKVEDFVQQQALLYDKNDPVQYWNVHFSAGADSVFMRDYAKEIALETCIRDLIYAQRAREEGYALSAEEEQQALERSRNVFDGMEPAQRDATGLTWEDILYIERNKLIGERYADNYLASHDVTVYGDSASGALSYDGAYYLQVIKPQHTVILNEDLIRKLSVGTITVNMGRAEK